MLLSLLIPLLKFHNGNDIGSLAYLLHVRVAFEQVDLSTSILHHEESQISIVTFLCCVIYRAI